MTEKEENYSQHPHEPAKDTFVRFNSDDDVLFATSTKKWGVSNWILDSWCAYHMCPHKDWFSTYNTGDSSIIHTSNNS